ncbi:flagellar hook-associated protein FlgK [Lentibacillus sediminis]|uniref:flagellar hook-associated protein FlgK n=1 Tax=Lentibacillus sediminis TaxID=1940529 RepID=UPI000C1C009E|nr:flagellar hook-associated protein FlgK [Lentibacillus sediminis]
MSTFYGLEMAKQALFAQQAALHTTGHNISNANTEGYSRQRVNFETNIPFPGASRNRPEIPGQIGTGVQVGAVERIRNEYLDGQFRSENSKAGFWETKADALRRMENVLNEPSEAGLSHSMDQLWQSLQDLSVNPENSGARSVVLQRGQALAETFQYLSQSLNTIRGDLKTEIDTKLNNANSLLTQIQEINVQVKHSETHGYLTNDLYDRRDNLIDELSNIMPISTSYDNSHATSEMAAGVVTITVVGENGASLTLLDGISGEVQQFDEAVTETVDGVEVISDITAGGVSLPFKDANGSLSGLIEAYGHTFNGDVEGEFTSVLSSLDQAAKSFVDAFNEVHREGTGLDGSTGVNFFSEIGEVSGAAGAIEVALEEPDQIAASLNGNMGDGQNALELAQVFDEDLDGLDNSSVKDFYEGVIGSLGVQAQEANRMADNTGMLRSQVENQRMSVSSVSLDEEMSNMIKFQHAYNAAARTMTATDELLDRVINNMGLVGR